MGVVGSAQLRQGYPKADFSLTGRKYTVQWLVTVDSYNDGPIVAQSAPGLPAAFSTYAIGSETDIYARIREWSANRLEDNSLTWVVEAQYSTPPEKSGGGGGAGGGGPTGAGGGTHTDTAGDYTNPLLELPTVKMGSVEKETPISRVFNVSSGRYNAPMNSACEVFNPPAMRKLRHLTLTISRNEALSSPHPALGIQYSLAVNSDYWWGMTPGTWQCQSITAERQTKQIQGGTIFAYLKVEYQFQAHPDGWDVIILNAGNYFCSADAAGSGSGGSGSGPNCCGSGGTPANDVGSFGEWCRDAAGQLYRADCGSGSGSGYDTAGNLCPACTNKTAFQDQQGHPIKGLLNWNGGQLAQGADPLYMRLRPYQWLPFGPLGLPQAFTAVQ